MKIETKYFDEYDGECRVICLQDCIIKYPVSDPLNGDYEVDYLIKKDEVGEWTGYGAGNNIDKYIDLEFSEGRSFSIKLHMDFTHENFRIYTQEEQNRDVFLNSCTRENK